MTSAQALRKRLPLNPAPVSTENALELDIVNQPITSGCFILTAARAYRGLPKRLAASVDGCLNPPNSGDVMMKSQRRASRRARRGDAVTGGCDERRLTVLRTAGKGLL